MVNKIEISHKTIFFTALFIAAIWLVIFIKDIILLLFLSFIIMSALEPVVDKLEHYRIPRAIAILLIYLVGILVIGFIGTIVMPPLVNQSIRLITRLPEFVNSIYPNAGLSLETVINQFIPVGQGVLMLSIGVFSNIISVVTFLVFTFYFLLESKKLNSYIKNFVGEDAGNKTVKIVKSIEDKLGAWVRGQLTLMFIVGLITYIGLLILRIDYALPLAIFAGIMEVVPIIGPIISAIPSVLVAFVTSPGLGLVVIVLYILVQQTENNLIVPTVMRRAVGLPPLVTILSLMIGGKLAGITGALLSVPVVVMLEILVKELLKSRNKPLNIVNPN